LFELVGRPGLDPGTLGLKVLVKPLRRVARRRTVSQKWLVGRSPAHSLIRHAATPSLVTPNAYLIRRQANRLALRPKREFALSPETHAGISTSTSQSST
jgi:hypothetical protein